MRTILILIAITLFSCSKEEMIEESPCKKYQVYSNAGGTTMSGYINECY